MNRSLPNQVTLLDVAHPSPIVAPSAKPAAPAAAAGLMEICWRRRRMMALSLVVCLIAAAAYCYFATPLYTATAVLYVQKAGPVILQDGTQYGDRGDTYLATQSSLLCCFPVVDTAMKAVEAEYAPTGKKLSDLAIFQGQGNPVNYVRKYLLVEIGKKDSLINVSIDSPDSDEAAAVVNAVVNSYKADQLKQTQSVAGEVGDILAKERATQEAQLAQQEALMYDYKEKHPGLQQVTNEGNIVIAKLAKLSDALTQAEIDAMNARVLYAESNAKRIMAAQVSLTEKRRAELKHAYDAQFTEATKLNVAETEYTKLVTEVERTRKMIDALQMRQNEVEANRQVGGMNVRIVEAATAPNKPSKPQVLRVLALAVALGLMLGTGGAYWRESTDQRLTSAEEISALLGLPVLGTIPSMPGRQTAVTRGQKVHLDSMSDVAEAFRTLRTVIYFSAPTEQAKTLLITSPLPGEGKSTTASGLAIAMAKAGRRTLLIDTDLRKPTLHRIFETDNSVGISSVISGKESLDAAIHPTAVDGLDLLPCGPLPQNPSEILNSQAFGELLEKLSGRYDHILLDSPPVLSVTDARILGAVCDLSLLVLRANVSSRRVSEHACAAMNHVGARLLGVVVNDVPRRGSGYYGGNYGYGYYGYGRAQLAAGHGNGNGNGNGNGHGAHHRRLPEPADADRA